MFQNDCKWADTITAAENKFIIHMLVVIPRQDYFANRSEDSPKGESKVRKTPPKGKYSDKSDDKNTYII